jgi:membrane protein DedA with SNARE-associated domain
MTSILSLLTTPPAPIPLIVAAAILIGEPALLAGVVLPSVTAALVLGFLAYTGLVPLPIVLATAAAAVICGDAIGYLAGRRHAQRRPATPRPPAGDHQASGKPHRYWTRLYGRVQRSIRTVHRPRAARLVARHGGRTVFLARWIVGARTLVPRLAGEGGTSAWGFARWSVPAGLAWSTSYVLAGYLGGSSLDDLSALMSQASLAIVALLLTVGSAAILLRRWGRRSPARAATAVDGRPLWTTRDRDSEHLRTVLRRAGRQELSARRSGFVVEPGTPWPVPGHVRRRGPGARVRWARKKRLRAFKTAMAWWRRVTQRCRMLFVHWAWTRNFWMTG